MRVASASSDAVRDVTVVVVLQRYSDNQELHRLAGRQREKCITVGFNANGGAGAAMANEAFTYGAAAALTTNTYTRAGYTFLGWSTDKNATTATYADNASVSNLTATSGDTVTLYAIWQEVGAVNITYQPNDTVMGETQPTNESLQPATGAAAGSTATPKTGYHFVNWTNDKDATETTDAILSATQVDAVAKASGIYEATTFTAHFAGNAYTVAFNANGGTGTAMTDEICAYGIAAALTANTYTRAGYTFLGWSTDANAAVATYTDEESIIDLTTVDGEVVTLYAVWSKDGAPGSVNPPDSNNNGGSYSGTDQNNASTIDATSSIASNTADNSVSTNGSSTGSTGDTLTAAGITMCILLVTIACLCLALFRRRTPRGAHIRH